MGVGCQSVKKQDIPWLCVSVCDGAATLNKHTLAHICTCMCVGKIMPVVYPWACVKPPLLVTPPKHRHPPLPSFPLPPTHQTVGQGDGARGWLCFLLALELVGGRFLKLGRQLGQVLIKVLMGAQRRERGRVTAGQASTGGVAWERHLKHKARPKRAFKDLRGREEQRWLKKKKSLSLGRNLGVKSWAKLILSSTMDLFGIWKQLAQGQTGLIGREAHRFSRLVWGLLIPFGSEPTLRSSVRGWGLKNDIEKSCWILLGVASPHSAGFDVNSGGRRGILSPALCWGSLPLWCAECQTPVTNNYLQLLLSIGF